MAFYKKQFQDLIERTLKNMELYSESATNLLLGTAAQESHFGTYLRQLGGGPALGVFQMEPETEIDIWNNYLRYRISRDIMVTRIAGVTGPSVAALEANLIYQIVMARLHYKRIKDPFPPPKDIDGLARYWDQHYNRNPLAGTEEEFIENYKKYVI